MARSDRSRRVLIVFAFFAGALGFGAAGACSAVPDVTYVGPDAPASSTPPTDGPNPIDTGPKDTGIDTGSCGLAAGAGRCCGTIPCYGCSTENDCLGCNGCLKTQFCCKKGGGSSPVDCKDSSDCK